MTTIPKTIATKAAAEFASGRLGPGWYSDGHGESTAVSPSSALRNPPRHQRLPEAKGGEKDAGGFGDGYYLTINDERHLRQRQRAVAANTVDEMKLCVAFSGVFARCSFVERPKTSSVEDIQPDRNATRLPFLLA